MRRQPGDREVAPGGLALVQSFVNSINVEFGPDEFATADGLGGWLESNGFDGMRPDDLDRQEAVALRESLRALLKENNGGELDAGAHRTFEHITRNCPLIVKFDRDNTIGLAPAQTDMRGALGVVLASVVTAVTDGSWQRLKVCQEHRCEWAFFDRSRNRASRWCSMAVCGTRAKMRVYRQAKRDRG